MIVKMENQTHQNMASCIKAHLFRLNQLVPVPRNNLRNHNELRDWHSPTIQVSTPSPHISQLTLALAIGLGVQRIFVGLFSAGIHVWVETTAPPPTQSHHPCSKADLYNMRRIGLCFRSDENFNLVQLLIRFNN